MRCDRLLLVGPSPPPAGGIASAVEAVADAIRKRGPSVTVLDPCLGAGTLLWEIGRAPKTLIHVHVCGHNWQSYAITALARAAAPRAPLVVTLHSGILRPYLERPGELRRLGIRTLLERTDQVVCVSEVNRTAVEAVGVKAGKLSVASPFIGEAVVQRGARVATDAGEVRLCAMVAPEGFYGADLLVEAFARLIGSGLHARLSPRRPTLQLPPFAIRLADEAVGFGRVLRAQIHRVPFQFFADAIRHVAKMVRFRERAGVIEV